MERNVEGKSQDGDEQEGKQLTLGERLSRSNKKLQDEITKCMISAITRKLEELLASMKEPVYEIMLPFEVLRIEPRVVDNVLCQSVATWAVKQDLYLDKVYDHSLCQDCDDNGPDCQLCGFRLSWDN